MEHTIIQQLEICLALNMLKVQLDVDVMENAMVLGIIPGLALLCLLPLEQIYVMKSY